MHNKKRPSKVRLLKRSLIGLFIPAKPNVTLVNNKEENYSHYYFPKNLCDGIELITAIERITRKMQQRR